MDKRGNTSLGAGVEHMSQVLPGESWVLCLQVCFCCLMYILLYQPQAWWPAHDWISTCGGLRNWLLVYRLVSELCTLLEWTNVVWFIVVIVCVLIGGIMVLEMLHFYCTTCELTIVYCGQLLLFLLWQYHCVIWECFNFIGCLLLLLCSVVISWYWKCYIFDVATHVSSCELIIIISVLIYCHYRLVQYGVMIIIGLEVFRYHSMIQYISLHYKMISSSIIIISPWNQVIMTTNIINPLEFTQGTTHHSGCSCEFKWVVVISMVILLLLLLLLLLACGRHNQV